MSGPAALAIVLALAYCLVLVWLATRQRRIMYVPRTDAIAPAQAGLPEAQAIVLETSDGIRLVAWFIPPRGGEPLLLYFHGNAGHLANLAGRFAALTAKGAGLLAVEYRGFGGSGGRPAEKGLHLDADAAYAEALKRGYRPEHVIVIGESLGTGVAVALASRAEVAGVILEAAYTSTTDIAAAVYWQFPVRWLLLDRFRSDLRIGSIAAPILFLHGTEDLAIPIRFGERLFKLAPEPKTFIRIEGGGHQVMDLPQVMSEVCAWIAARCRAPAISAEK
ncbi:MAG: alpha/beta hydrolase [Methylobacteriaceae bacterium]|nr:alpha/beta hydrolase [Methylobacteriaceae bacterium]